MKKANKHTPSPWLRQGQGTVTDSSNGIPMLTHIIETGDGSIEVIDETGKPEQNLNLIASAPRMLAALEQAQRDIYENINGRMNNMSLTWHDIKSVIAAAKGQ